ncbi:LysR family transcriptional regulator [Megalodesulfovibrio paquesii]
MELCVVLAEERHFGRASARLHMTQPPFSQRLSRLEEELGVRLFERSNREVAVTPAGEAFLEEARVALDAARRAVLKSRQAAAGEIGRVRLGFVGPSLEGSLPVLLRRCREAYPGIVLELKELHTGPQLEQLRAGNLDAGFVRLYGEQPPGLDSVVVMQDEYMLAVPAGHALEGGESIPLAAVRGEPWIMYPRQIQPQLYDAVSAAFARAGAPMQVVQEAVGKRTTLALVAAGFGVALMPRTMSDGGRPGVSFVSLGPGLPQVQIHLAWPSGAQSPALRRVLEMLLLKD